MDCDAIILGAGVSGLTLAHELSAQGSKVCLVDDYEHLGGNHRSLNLDEMSFDIGAIFFWPGNLLFEIFPELQQLCTRAPWILERIVPDGRVLAYPFEPRTEVFGRSGTYLVSVLISLLRGRLRGLRRHSAHDYLRYWLGDRLLEDTGISYYVERLFSLPCEQISYAFAEQRLRDIARGASLTAMAKAVRVMAAGGQRGAPSRTVLALARPQSGFADFYACAGQQLRDAGVSIALGAGIRSIRSRPGAHLVESNQGTLRSQRLISTMPMEAVARWTDLPLAAEPPVSRTLTTLCCRFRGQRGFKGTILYNFRRSGAWKRLTVHSDYYGETTDGWSYCSVETTALTASQSDARAVFDDFASSYRSVGLLLGDLELVDVMRTDYGYPLYELGFERKREALAAQLAACGIETVGRQGEFLYVPYSGLAVNRVQDYLRQRAPEREGAL